jgi:cytochrome c oxidase subunit 4
MVESPHHDHNAHTGDIHEVASVTSSLTTFAVLAMLAILALVVGFSNLGEIKVIISLTVAATQSLVLSLFFMDLRRADPLIWLVASSGVFWVGLMFLFIITDYLTRHIAVL